jgi:hypothetical protein
MDLRKPHSTLQFVLRSTGVDRAVVYATLTSITPLIVGPVTVLLIASQFSLVLQGYYYTFGSLLALQYLFELGLGQAIIQFASHEWSQLNFNDEGQIVGAADSLSRLISLGRQSIKWYSALAVLIVILLVPVGFLLFASSGNTEIQWVGPWLALCVGTGISLILLPLFYLLQGCNQVSQFWFYRWIQQVVNGLALWFAIALGAALWTLAIATFAGLVWSIIFLIYRYRPFVITFFRVQHGHAIIDWRTEVWPLQWRIAITWASTYFPPQLFVPVLFVFSGPVVAGQMGMTTTLGSVLIAVSSNWIVTKAPRFGILIAGKKFKELDNLFFRSFFISVIVACLGAILLWCGIVLLSALNLPFATRILAPLPAGLLLAASVLTSAAISLNIYLRAYKKEPLARVFLIASLAIAALTLLLGSQFGAVGVTMGYLGVLIFYQIPSTVQVFQHSRVSWQHPQPLSA